jgi:hypothetical protein
VKHIILQVTDEHVRKGVPDDAFECPVALALKELLADDFELSVSRYGIVIFEGGHTHYVGGELPDVACVFMHWFDSRRAHGLAEPACEDGFIVPIEIAAEHERFFNSDLLVEKSAQ